MVDAVSFAMYLIDRGRLDGCTLADWMKYVRTSNAEEFREINSLCLTVPGASYDHEGFWNVRIEYALLGYLYPDEWKQWFAICRLTGEDLR